MFKGNMKKIMKQAKEMQDQMMKTQQELEAMEVEGTAGGDLVKVILKGDYEMKSISVNENAKNEKDEIINDLIVAAHNDAREKLKKKTSEELLKVTGASNLPFDFKLPF